MKVYFFSFLNMQKFNSMWVLLVYTIPLMVDEEKICIVQTDVHEMREGRGKKKVK